MTRIRVLVVDESVLGRDLLRRALADAKDVELVGSAPTAKTGLARALQATPDLLLLSSSLPDSSPAALTRELLKARPDVGVLLTTEEEAGAAERVLQALEAGAADFVVRAGADAPDAAEQIMRRRLLPKIRALSTAIYSRVARRLSTGKQHPAAGPLAAPAAGVARLRKAKLDAGGVAAVLVGVSTGGPEALATLVPSLPGDFPSPIVVVAHMPRLFTASCAAALDRRSSLTVQEAQHGDVLTAGNVYVAPGGLHLRAETAAEGAWVLRTDDGPPVHGCKPAVDVLFGSAAATGARGLVALILTGMGEDGVAGLRALKGTDAHVLAQDEATSVIWGMPGSAVRAGVVDDVLPLPQIAERLLQLVGRS